MVEEAGGGGGGGLDGRARKGGPAAGWAAPRAADGSGSSLNGVEELGERGGGSGLVGRKAAGCAGRQSTDCVPGEVGGGGNGENGAAHGHDLTEYGASAGSSRHKREHA